MLSLSAVIERTDSVIVALNSSMLALSSACSCDIRPFIRSAMPRRWSRSCAQVGDPLVEQRGHLCDLLVGLAAMRSS